MSTDTNRLWAVFAYFLGIVSAVIAYFIKKDDAYVRFHAVQSMLFGIIAIILNQLIGIFAKLSFGLYEVAYPSFGLAAFFIWLFLMWKAWEGEKYKLPLAGEYAEQHSK